MIQTHLKPIPEDQIGDMNELKVCSIGEIDMVTDYTLLKCKHLIKLNQTRYVELRVKRTIISAKVAYNIFYAFGIERPIKSDVAETYRGYKSENLPLIFETFMQMLDEAEVWAGPQINTKFSTTSKG